MWTPRALARFLPSLVRALINSRSNSAKPPRTVRMSLPCAVVVSAQVSASDLKPAPALAMPSKMVNKSKVLRANLSRRVTNKTSPGPNPFNARLSPGDLLRVNFVGACLLQLI